MTKAIQRSKNSNWNDSFNTIKILLIFLVVIGHIMSGQTPLTRFIIYTISTFNMELFFGISGYLLKKELFTQPLLQLSTKYYHRLIIPFLFTFIVFSFITREPINPLYPYFHLWFITAFLLMIFYLYIIEHYKVNKIFVFFLLALLTIVWRSNFVSGPASEIFYYLGDKRYYYFFIYLYSGYILRNYHENFSIPLWLSILVLLPSGTYIVFLNNDGVPNLLNAFTRLLFNLSLIYVVINYANRYANMKIPIISDLGSITLPLYLWHVLPLVILWKLQSIYNISGIYYYLAYFSAFIILTIFIQKSRQTKLGRILITGERKL